MAPARASGHSLVSKDIPLVLGMVARGDRRHDIAAWFGVNQGRIKEAQDGKFGTPPAAPTHQLPPSGPPGIKGRRLRKAADDALKTLVAGKATAAADAMTVLRDAIAQYDLNEG